MPATLYADTITKNGEALTVDEAMEASGFGIEGAKVLADYVDKNRGIPFSDITGQTLVSYLAGTSNKVDFKAEPGSLQESMFEAGRRDRAASKLSIQNEVGTNKVFSRRESGLITPDSKYKGNLNPIATPMDVSPALARAINAYGKGIGKKMVFVNNVWVKDENGKVVGEANAESRSDGVTLLSANAKKKLYSLILHEGVHDFRRYNTNEYHAFIDFALQHQESLGIRIITNDAENTTFEHLQKIYSEKGLTLELERTLDEIGARFAEKLFGDEATAIEFINKMNETPETRTALQKFMDAIKKIIRKLRGIKDGLVKAGDRAAAKELNMTIAELERGRQLYADAYKATSKAVAERQKTENNLEIKTKKDYNGNSSYDLDSSETETYTDEEYRDYGWARENNILSADQNADFHSKFALAKSGQMKFPKSKKGEFIIPVSDIYHSDREGINNFLVFAKGTIKNPIITSVIEIYEFDETSLDEKRRVIYESERRGIQPEIEDVFGRYDSVTFQDRRPRTVFEGDRDNSDYGHRGRSGEETSYFEGRTGEKAKKVESDYSLKDEINSLPAEDKEIVLEARQRAIYSTSIATMSEDRLSKAYDDYSDSMKVEFEKVIDGISRYMNSEIYAGMNAWQDFAARIMVGRIVGNQEAVKDMLMNNVFAKTFGIVDSDGMVDVDSLAKDIRRELARRERMTVEIPMFGKYTFSPSDVDALYQEITGQELMINEAY